jgi:hypothetical protein
MEAHKRDHTSYSPDLQFSAVDEETLKSNAPKVSTTVSGF